MFESISSKIEKALHTLRGKGSITDINVAETVKEVRKALLDADVSYPVAKEFTDKVKAEAMGRNVIQSIEPGQLMVKIVHEKLTELMGNAAVDINIKGTPAIILIAGLQGSGKTTFSAKLAHYLKTKRNKSVMLVAGDVYRPAAISQLKTLGEQIQVPVFTEEGNMNPIDIATKAVRDARLKGTNVVIVDTAGRLAVDEEMMNEISGLKQSLNPQETLFVVDSMTGQDAVNTAKAFNDRLDFDGVVLTKLDGDTRGGAALTIRYSVQKPIKFVGIGEKMDALDVFHPDRMASRILGMGDVAGGTCPRAIRRGGSPQDTKETHPQRIQLRGFPLTDRPGEKDGQHERPYRHDSRNGQTDQERGDYRRCLQAHRVHDWQHDAL